MKPSLSLRLKPLQLKLIVAIKDFGKLHLAADYVGMSQPAASRILSEVEMNVGVALFNRLPRGMELTETGLAFVHRARIILSELEALTGEVAELGGGRAGTIRIGAVTGPAVGVLLPALKALREELPNIEPTIEVAPSATLIRGLEEGRFDFVLARLGSAQRTREFMAYPGRTEEVCLVVRATHPLVGKKVSLAETLPFDFVIQETGSPIRSALELAFLEHGLVTPKRVTNSSSLLVALNLIADTDTIAPQTREVAQLLTRTTSNLAIIEITPRILVSPFMVLQPRHRPLSQIAERLMKEVMQRL